MEHLYVIELCNATNCFPENLSLKVPSKCVLDNSKMTTNSYSKKFESNFKKRMYFNQNNSEVASIDSA